MATEYRSKTRYRIEPAPSMGAPMISVIGIDDNMIYAVIGEDDFAARYEAIEEPEPETV